MVEILKNGVANLTNNYASLQLDAKNFNLDSNQEILKQAILQADYFSIDTEFSQIGKSKGLESYKEVYCKNKDLLTKSGLFQVGLTCFKYTTSAEKIVELQYSTFTLAVVPKTNEDYSNTMSASISAMKFLAENSFNFTHIFANGIEYEKPCDFKGFEQSPKQSKEEGFKLENLFELITKSNKPVVLHCGLHDTIYLYNHFCKILPDTYEEFKTSILKMFTKIYDTKFLAEKYCNIDHSESSLSVLYEKLIGDSGANIKISPLLNISDKLSSENCVAHDAGYDSFMTAYVYTKLVALNSQKIDLNQAENKLYSRMDSIDYINLNSPEDCKKEAAANE